MKEGAVEVGVEALGVNVQRCSVSHEQGEGRLDAVQRLSVAQVLCSIDGAS